MEWLTHPRPSFFVTLTYNDETVPVTPEGVPTLRKREFLTWLNNTQQRSSGFRYYAVGEYGEKSLRPHYHLALFPNTDSGLSELTESWKQGFSSAYTLNEARSQYLAHYTTKKLTADSDERLEIGQEPEFRTSSRKPPLGAAFVSMVVRQYSSASGRSVLERDGDVGRTFRTGGKVLPIPQWCLTKIREELGIPTRHEDRLLHDGYYEMWANRDFAEIDFDSADKVDELWKIKKRQGHHRGKAQKV